MAKRNLSEKEKIAESVLDYWHTLEFLNQDALPELTYEERKKNQKEKKRVRDANISAPQPIKGHETGSEAISCEAAGQGRNKDDEKEVKVLKLLTPVSKGCDLLTTAQAEAKDHGMSCWGNITIYGGTCSRENCIQYIAKALHEEDHRPEKSADTIAWFSFQIGPQGRYVEGSFSLSTIIWALSRIESKNSRFLSELLSEQAYRDDMQEFETYLRELGKSEKTEKERTEKEKNDAPQATEEQETAEAFAELDSSGCAGKMEEPFCAITTDNIYTICKDIREKYLKRMKKDDVGGDSCLLLYQAFRDEESRERFEDDDYIGLSRAFFVDDLKLVLTEAQNGLLGHPKARGSMQDVLIDYIAGAHDEYYSDENAQSALKRFDCSGADPKALRQFFAAVLDVREAPLGKWPSKFMPSLMQQTAVNLAAGHGGENGPVFSVNGPPGTGKTTLLKEIIVDHIVRRGLLLAAYKTPDDAFTECSFVHGNKKNHGYSDYFSKYYKLKNDRINDYSILVTSCNNAAVENITKELPLEAGITGALKSGPSDSEQMKEQLKEVQKLFTVDESSTYEELYNKEIRKKKNNEIKKKGAYQDIYFTEYSRDLLDDDGAWGLISAALGKKSNIHRFYQNVLRPLDGDFYINDKLDFRLERYRQARERLLDQQKKVERLREELARNCQEEKNIRELCRKGKERITSLTQDNARKMYELEEKKQKIEHWNALYEELQKKQQLQASALQSAYEQWEKGKQEFAAADNGYEKKLKDSIEARSSIHLFGKLFHSHDAKVKNQLADKYAAEAQELKLTADNLKLQCERLKATYEAAEREAVRGKAKLLQHGESKDAALKEIASLKAAIEANTREIPLCEQEIDAKTEEYRQKLRAAADAADDTNGFTALDDRFMEDLKSGDEEKSTHAQVSNPWFTNHYNREREKMFYLALMLHKEFVLSSRCCLRNYRNLALLWQEAAVDNERVSFHQEDREASFGILLQSLFLLVPVISTTFASVGRFLKDIKIPGMLGTLIVDEAGQAPPQMAVGALFRSRRAVIVGDPKQVEPVVTDDLLLLKNAYKEDVYQPYKSKKLSVQQFADRMNPYGTYLENEHNEKEWVGCPLIVHRRCISPMYEISNYISYNNTMKQQTGEPSEKKEQGFCYSGSRWINVSGREKGSRNHYVEEQGKRVLEILELAFLKSQTPSLFIITPFTTVKSGMIKCIENSLNTDRRSVLYGRQSDVRKWMYKNIGTVHTFQGKEADEVIFLLGCDTSKEAGSAIRWVNANIVNVAVTRAKYRIYMVGDERAWSESRYISQAKKLIDLYALKRLSSVVNGTAEGNEEERKKQALSFSTQLPTVESVSMEAVENEDGQIEYAADPDIYLNEIKQGGLLLQELTDEQLEGYGFTRKAFQALNPQVRENIEWGIKLYSMFKKLIKQFGIKDLDASCCAILFCKATELQVKECLWDGLKTQLPNFQIRELGGPNKPLKEVNKGKTTLGSFHKILSNSANQKALAAYLCQNQKIRYDEKWWNQFSQRLKECTDLRNSCCHCGRFTWDQTNTLLIDLFLRDKGNNEPIMDGIIRDSEIGKELLTAP